MLTLGGVVVLVAIVMIQGFHNFELDMALSAVRLGGIEFTTARPYYVLGSMDYLVNDTTKIVNIIPKYTAYSSSVPASDIAAARDKSVSRLQTVFQPNATSIPADGCQNASFRRYCVQVQIVTPTP